MGLEGEREGGRDSVTLPKGVCAVRTCKRVSGLLPRARGCGVLGASTRACARRQLVRVRARAPADAGADRINGRALLAASRLDSREDGKATHLEQSWR